MKYKKLIWFIVIFILGVLLFPIRKVYEDRIEYHAISYSVVTFHKEKTGTEIRIFSYLIYQNVKVDKRVLKVNGDLYYETEFHQGDNWNSCGPYHGKIKTHVKEFEIPINDDESNFEGDYEYQIMNDNVIKICPGDTTIYFVKNPITTDSFDSVLDGSLDVNSSFVVDLYEKVNPSHDVSIIKGLYEKEGTFSNEYILSVGIVNLIKEKFYRNEEYLREEDVSQMIHRILGFHTKFVHQDVLVFSLDSYSEGICGYNYLPESHKYQLLHGCGGNFYEFFRRKIVSAEKEGDFVYLKEKLIYFYNDWNEYASKVSVYNNYNREKLLDYIESDGSQNYKVSIENYMENASTFLYTFKKQNGEYILESLTREF